MEMLIGMQILRNLLIYDHSRSRSQDFSRIHLLHVRQPIEFTPSAVLSTEYLPSTWRVFWDQKYWPVFKRLTRSSLTRSAHDLHTFGLSALCITVSIVDCIDQHSRLCVENLKVENLVCLNETQSERPKEIEQRSLHTGLERERPEKPFLGENTV